MSRTHMSQNSRMSQRAKQPTTMWRGVIALGMIGALVGCSGQATPADSTDRDAAAGQNAAPAAERTAEKVVQISEVNPQLGLTLIEGPTFGPDGSLFVVNVAPAKGDPKVLKVDVDAQTVEGIYTDETSAFTSAQFSPQDGRLYLTDFMGEVESITAEGTDPQTFFSGNVEGTPMKVDDLAFDEAGHLFVSDTTGHDGPAPEAKGRIVRIDKDTAEPTVLAKDLPAPNGISFTEDFKGLWVSQYSENRIDYLGLNEDKTGVEASHTGIHFSGGKSQIDSNAVDEDGNIYQAVHGQPNIFVYSPEGELLSTVSVPADAAEGLSSATNVAIKPGTTEAYMTVSGADGGFVYSFEALGSGIRQSNGG